MNEFVNGLFSPNGSRFYGKTQRGSRDTHETDTRAHLGSIVPGLPGTFQGGERKSRYAMRPRTGKLARNRNVYTYLWVGPGTQSEGSSFKLGRQKRPVLPPARITCIT